MITYLFLLIVLLPVAFLSVNPESFFSPDELTEMGIRLDHRDSEEMYCISKQFLVQRNY